MNKAAENSSVNIGSHDPVDLEAQTTDDTQKIPRRCVGYICMTVEERAAHDAKWAKWYWLFPLLSLILVGAFKIIFILPR